MGHYQNICATIAYTGTPGDVNHSNDQACVALSVAAALAHDVQITATLFPATVHHVGNALTFDFAPFNRGAGSIGAGGVTITGSRPAGLPANSALQLDWDCSASSGLMFSCTYRGPTVVAMQPIGQFIFATVAQSAGSLTFCADIRYNGPTPETSLSNNHSCVSTSVVALPQHAARFGPSVRHPDRR